MALIDLLILEVLNLFGYNTSLLAIYIGTIENCRNYVQVKLKISEFSILLLLYLAQVQCGGALRSRTRFLFTVLGVSPKPFSLLSFQLPLPYANVYTVYLDKLIKKNVN